MLKIMRQFSVQSTSTLSTVIILVGCLSFLNIANFTTDTSAWINTANYLEYALFMCIGIMVAVAVCDNWDWYDYFHQDLRSWEKIDNFLGRWILLSSSFIPDLLLLSQKGQINIAVNSTRDNFVLILSSICSFRLLVFVAYTVRKISVVQFRGGHTLIRSLAVSILLSCLTFHILRLSAFCHVGTEWRILATTSTVFQTMVIAQGIILGIAWKYEGNKQQIESKLIDGDDRVEADWCLVILIFRLFCSLILILSNRTIEIGNDLISYRTLCIDSYIQIVLVAVVLLAPQKHAERLTKKHLGRLITDKSAFTRYISHEIRTPLNIIQLSTGFVESETDSLGRLVGREKIAVLTEAIEDINESCDTAVTVLDDLLTMEKMQAEKLVMDVELMSPLVLIASVYSQFATIARESQIDFDLECEEEDSGWAVPGPDGFAALMDRRKMSQVLRNLLLNALKFSSARGKVTLKISRRVISVPSKPHDKVSRWSWLSRPNHRSVAPDMDPAASAFAGGSVQHSPIVPSLFTWSSSWGAHAPKNAVAPDSPCAVGGAGGDVEMGAGVASAETRNLLQYRLVISIIDTGIGMSKENQARLFGEYVQFNAAVKQDEKGSGLGLWISKGIVDLHEGGTIKGHSDGEGMGSTFTVELPLQHAPVEPFSPLLRNSPSAPSIERPADINNESSNARQNDFSRGDKAEMVESFCYSQALDLEKDDANADSCNIDDDGHVLNPKAFADVAAIVSMAGDSESLKVKGGSVRDAAPAMMSPAANEFSPLLHLEDQMNGSSFLHGPSIATTLSSINMPSRGTLRAEDGRWGSWVADEKLDEVPVRRGINSRRITDGHDDRSSCSSEKSTSFYGLGRRQRATPNSSFAVHALEQKHRGKQLRASAAKNSDNIMKSAGNLLFYIVDDSNSSRKSVRRLLLKQGHRVMEAVDGTEFVRTMEASMVAGEGLPDVVLMDNLMPEMNGPEATRRVREIGYKGLIIGLTATVQVKELQLLQRSGVDNVLLKPLSMGDLQTITFAWVIKYGPHSPESSRLFNHQGDNQPLRAAQESGPDSSDEASHSPAQTMVSKDIIQVGDAVVASMLQRVEEEALKEPLPVSLPPVDAAKLWRDGLQFVLVAKSTNTRKALGGALSAEGHSVSLFVDAAHLLRALRVRNFKRANPDSIGTGGDEDNSLCSVRSDNLSLTSPPCEEGVRIIKSVSSFCDVIVIDSDVLTPTGPTAGIGTLDSLTPEKLADESNYRDKLFANIVKRLRQSGYQNVVVRIMDEPFEALGPVGGALNEQDPMIKILYKPVQHAALRDTVLDGIKRYHNGGVVTSSPQAAAAVPKALTDRRASEAKIGNREEGQGAAAAAAAEANKAPLGEAKEASEEEVTLSYMAKASNETVGTVLDQQQQEQQQDHQHDRMQKILLHEKSKPFLRHVAKDGVDASAGAVTEAARSSPLKGRIRPQGGAAKEQQQQESSSRVLEKPQTRWEKGLNILVVDDSAPNRKVLRRLLVSHGHRISEAYDGLEFLRMMEESFAAVARQSPNAVPAGNAVTTTNAANAADAANIVDAIDAATGTSSVDIRRSSVGKGAADHAVEVMSGEPRSQYDVVLMDHLMPRMNGSEATKEIRRRGYKGLIVGLTGHTLESDVAFFLSNGVDHVLPKPLKLKDFKEIISAKLVT